MYDQIYWILTYGDNKHFDPVSLRPEMRDYTIYIDGISKSFAATGVRVGWAFGPKGIMEKMKSILSHVGAWAPKAEQVATTRYLKNRTAVDTYISDFKQQIETRLIRFYKGFKALKAEGFNVECVEPMAAIYLTIQFDLKGKKTATGAILKTQADVSRYILDEASLAVIPFFAFGTPGESSWYRLSVGTCKTEDIDEVIGALRVALKKLQ
jgi:aspartate aminotransferase